MKKDEVLAKMYDEASEHLSSLECYEEFPDVPRQWVDEAKFLVQALLRGLAAKEREAIRKGKK